MSSATPATVCFHLVARHTLMVSMWVADMFHSKISLNALDRGSLSVAEIELQRSERLGRQGR